MGKIICKSAKKLGSKSKIINIVNPRVENEKHKMRMENKEFLKILKSKPIFLKKEAGFIIKSLIENKKLIERHKKSLLK